MPFPVRVIALTLILCLNISAQTKKPKANSEEADAEAAQQRTIAISLVTSLADEAEILRIVKNAELTSIQKVWALTAAAKLVATTERSRAVEILEQAATEARRISGSDPDRAKALTAVAVGFDELDRVRSWEMLAEVVKAANVAEGFTGEDSRVSSRLQTKMMVVMSQVSAPDFDLLALFRHLAPADLLRAVQLAKTFTGEAPRAVATLAIARSVLEKRKDQTPGGTN